MGFGFLVTDEAHESSVQSRLHFKGAAVDFTALVIVTSDYFIVRNTR